jgi:hypothetical protein
MDVRNLTQAELSALMGTFSGPNTKRVTDYLNGFHLGPPTGNLLPGDSISYWAGYLLPSDNPAFVEMVRSLRRAFTFRNVLLESLELIADGVGVESADWGAALTRTTDKPSAQEEALLKEADAVLTKFWDSQDLPTVLYKALTSALAHGRQPVRPRIVPRFITAEGKPVNLPAERSLEPLRITLPAVDTSGVAEDQDSLETVGITQLAMNDFEVTYLTDSGLTVLENANKDTRTIAPPLNLRGKLWLLELKLPRPLATPDILSNQDALNVGLTMLSSNANEGGFGRFIAIGIDPILDKDDNPVPWKGAGSQTFLQPATFSEREVKEDGGKEIEVTRDRPYAGANVTRLEPTKPEALIAAIDVAETNVYKMLRLRFVGMEDQATASGRSREVAVGPYLRSVARTAAATEAFIRDLLEFALDISALFQGQPDKYKGLTVKVKLNQRVFEPSSETINTQMALQERGVISMQRLRALTGVTDPDAEQAQIDREAVTAPTPPAQ